MLQLNCFVILIVVILPNIHSLNSEEQVESFNEFSDELSDDFRSIITEENLQYLHLPLQVKSCSHHKTSSNVTYKLLDGHYKDASTLYRNGTSRFVKTVNTLKYFQVPFYFTDNFFWYRVQTTNKNNETTIGEIRGEAREFVYCITFSVDPISSVIKVVNGTLENSGKFSVRFENIDDSLRNEFIEISGNIFKAFVENNLLKLILNIFSYLQYIKNLQIKAFSD